MQIKINNNDINLNFGVRFIRELDNRIGVTVNLQGAQQNFGMALMKVVPAMQSYDVAILAEVMYCAAWDNKQRPSLAEIDNFIDNNDTDIDKLFNQVKAELERSNAAKTATKNLKA